MGLHIYIRAVFGYFFIHISVYIKDILKVSPDVSCPSIFYNLLVQVSVSCRVACPCLC